MILAKSTLNVDNFNFEMLALVPLLWLVVFFMFSFSLSPLSNVI